MVILFGHKAENASILFASSQKQVDLRTVFDEIQSIFEGKGGGQPDFIQGGGGNVKTLQTVLDKAEILVKSQFDMN